MCSKEETRTIVREANPMWMKYALGMLMTITIGVGGWNLKITIAQDTAIAVINTQLVNIKDVAITRSSDRYTGREARSRNALVDERCSNMSQRIDNLQRDIEQRHNGHGP